jgi:hypothetical protein
LEIQLDETGDYYLVARSELQKVTMSVDLMDGCWGVPRGTSLAVSMDLHSVDMMDELKVADSADLKVD